MITAEWKKLYPDDEIIRVVFHVAEWKRNNRYQWNSSARAWFHIDKSVLVALVIVKTEEKIATMYPCYLNKDNLKNGEIRVGAKTKEGRYVVREILISNL